MYRKILCIWLVVVAIISCSSCTNNTSSANSGDDSLITQRSNSEIPKIQDMTIETVDYDDPDSVGKYTYSLLPLSSLSQNKNESTYPSLDHMQYVYICEYDHGERSVLVDYIYGKVNYDSEREIVRAYSVGPELTRDLTGQDIDRIETILTEQDIFNWKIQYDGTGGQTLGEYEGMWLITILFDDGSYFQTSGVGDHAAGWPDKYYELKDELFALADS